jgi:hypothetical protein
LTGRTTAAPPRGTTIGRSCPVSISRVEVLTVKAYKKPEAKAIEQTTIIAATR